jgi:hypothetical protein
LGEYGSVDRRNFLKASIVATTSLTFPRAVSAQTPWPASPGEHILPDASSAWAEVERLCVPINRIDVRRGLIFGDLPQHYAEHELAEASESIRPKAHTTIKG